MSDVVALILGGVALFIAVVGWFGAKSSSAGLTRDQAVELFRGEYDRLRSTTDEQLRGVRSELMEGLRGNQESAVRVVNELGTNLKAEIIGFGERLDSGVARIEAQAKSIGETLDKELEKLATDAIEHRDRLRKAIEERLDKATTAQTEANAELRSAMLEAAQRDGKVTVDLLGQIGEQLKERLDTFTVTHAETALGTRTTLLTGIQEAGKSSTGLLCSPSEPAGRIELIL